MKISLKNSGVLNGGAAIPPTADHMEFGEVAINYSATDPAIFIKDSDGIIRRVSGKGNVSFDNYQAVIPISSTSPATVATGNLYWDQDDERLYIYNGSAWKDASKLPFDASTIPDLTNAADQSGTFDDRYFRYTGGTLTGTLTTSSGFFVNAAYIQFNNSYLAYQGASNGQGGFFKTTIDAVDATANNTINFPNRSGTVITTGDSGTITASMISSGSITDTQISSSAAISASKIATGTLPSGIKVNSANIVDGSIANADISSSAAIDLSKLGTGNLPSGIQVTTNNLTAGIPASDISSGTLGSGVTVSADNYQAGSISNAAISNTAEIAVSKLADGSARQLLQTNAFGNDVEWASDIDIPGTLDVTGNAVFDGRVTISDVFTVNSSEITLNAPVVNITDKNITLNSVGSPTDANADGGGISVAGSTTKTFTYDVSNSSFTSSEHLNLVTGKGYEINGTSVLTHTTLGSGVINSSLESVGTIHTGTWEGSVIDDIYISTIDTAGKVANSATTATSANTPNSIVSRDASGDFTARIVTAALNGNASTATALETARTITLGGVLNGSVSFDGTSDVTINAGILSSVTDTNLSWTPATMTIGSSTGEDVNLTLFTSTAPGLTPYSGGGTINFLRADGTWAKPATDPTNLSWTASTSTIGSSTGTGVAIPAFDSYNKGLVPSSGGGTTKFLRADGTWVTIGTGTQGSDLAYVTSTRTVTNTNGDGFVIPEATTSDPGLLSSSDKTQLTNLNTNLAGKADLDNGKLDTSQLPDLAITEYLGSVANEAAMLALTGEKGDWAIRTDDGKVYVITGSDPSVASGWVSLSYPVGETPAEILTALKTVDGSGSGLDADLLDGEHGSSFLRSNANDTFTGIITGIRGGATDPILVIDGAGPNIIRFPDNGSNTLGIDLAYRVTPHTLGFEKSTDGTKLWETDCDTGATEFHYLVDAPTIYAGGEIMTSTAKLQVNGFMRAGTIYIHDFTNSVDSSLRNNNGVLEWDTNKIWHAGNDGSGSGLDADLLDGQHGSSYLRSNASDTATGTITFQNSSVLLDSTSSSIGPWQLSQDGNGNLNITISGTGGAEMVLSADGADYTTAVLTVAGSTVWHAGNDGPSSGLNADLLDGVEGANFLRSNTNDTMTGKLVIDVDNQADGALRILANQTNPNNDFYFAQEIVSTLSGATVTTGDREQGGLYIDLNSTATGGDTSNEHRAYGIYLDVDSTGDADAIYGIYANVAATPAAGTTSEVVGLYGVGEDNGGAGNVSNIYGVRGIAISDNSDSDANGLYGGHFKVQPVSDTGNIDTAHGCVAEIEIPSGMGDHLGDSYLFRAIHDNNDTVAQTNTTYLYHGQYDGTQPTTAYGVYIASNVPNYFAGSLTAATGATFTGNVVIDGNADLIVGDGAGDERIFIKKADNNVSDHIIFYTGATRIGEIGCEDASWLRINQETATNIYTPRYIRADAGFFVDGTAKGINGSGNFIGGTIAGASDYGTLIRSNADDNVTGHTEWQDNYHARFGNAADLRIYHNATNSHIDNNTGHLYIRNNVDADIGTNIYIQAKSGENSIVCNDDASVILYHNGTAALATSSAEVAGSVQIYNNLIPDTDNTGNVGTSTYTWNNGRFTNMTIDSTLSVRAALDLADGDALRMGSSDDFTVTYNSNGWNYVNMLQSGMIFQDNGINVCRLEDSAIFRPESDNSGNLGTSSVRWANGYFYNATVGSTLAVRVAIDLADNDILRFGSSDDAEFFCNGSHMYLDLNSGIGNFYIRDGTTTRFTFDDAGHFTATGNITAYSDITLKENIETIPNALNKVTSVRGITFDRKDQEGLRQTGVIAQEIETILPEAVITDEDGIKSVAYGNLAGLLIEAIKEQQHQIETMKEEINHLKENN